MTEMRLTEIIGIVLILTSPIFTVIWIITKNKNKAPLITLCSIVMFAGFGLIMQDRITELTFEGVGTIKAATEQAQSDADTITYLKGRVENQSVTVDLVAKEASKAKKISEEVAENNRRAEEKLYTLDEAITKANATLANLDATTEFTMIVLAAQTDDRKAYDMLKKMSEDTNNRFSSIATNAWNTIYESHNKLMYTSGLTVPWNKGFNPSQRSLTELDEAYHNASSQNKPALIEYIWGRNDIDEVDRLDFLIDVMKHDPSLAAVEYAGRYFNIGTGLRIKPMAIEYLVDWWGKHRLEYKGK
jgi:F0F1-type ATP synthase epsilon subunit